MLEILYNIPVGIIIILLVLWFFFTYLEIDKYNQGMKIFIYVLIGIIGVGLFIFFNIIDVEIKRDDHDHILNLYIKLGFAILFIIAAVLLIYFKDKNIFIGLLQIVFTGTKYEPLLTTYPDRIIIVLLFIILSLIIYIVDLVKSH